MTDWTLARQIARFAAGTGGPAPRLDADFGALSAQAEAPLREYTRLDPAGPLPAAEAVDRTEWAEINVESLGSAIGPVADRMFDRLASTGPLAGPLRAATGATVEAEIGLVLGYMSTRVLGQYELSLLQPETPPRLLFVAPNLARAVEELDVDRESFLSWVVLHELTHVLQFSGVPWLREHLSSLLREYLATVEVRIQRGSAGGLPALPNPAALVESFREGGLVALVQTREQRRIMDRVQSVMSVVEGYSEHVMDAVGERVLPTYDGLREAMQNRRRSRSAPERILQRLLGLDLKMRQYELGKTFCDGVASRHGIERLNRVWDSPESLPSAAELNDPDAWARRVSGPAAAAA